MTPGTATNEEVVSGRRKCWWSDLYFIEYIEDELKILENYL